MAAFTNKEKEYITRMIKEAREELDRLEKQIKEEKGVGFEDDVIFLLSTEEYEKYKDKIPAIEECWWLRSHGHFPDDAAVVGHSGDTNNFGLKVDWTCIAVRPALKLKEEYDVEARIVLADFPWIVIDKNLAIAEVPIAFIVFDTNGSSCYESSSIRAYLKKWLKDRSETSYVNCKEF